MTGALSGGGTCPVVSGKNNYGGLTSGTKKEKRLKIRAIKVNSVCLGCGVG